MSIMITKNTDQVIRFTRKFTVVTLQENLLLLLYKKIYCCYSTRKFTVVTLQENLLLLLYKNISHSILVYRKQT